MYINTEVTLIFSNLALTVKILEPRKRERAPIAGNMSLQTTCCEPQNAAIEISKKITHSAKMLFCNLALNNIKYPADPIIKAKTM